MGQYQEIDRITRTGGDELEVQVAILSILTGVPEDELMSRLIKRGQESGRSDDNAETIKKRLDVYHSQTAPLIEWYKKEGIHHHIDGLGALDRIFGDIQKVIDNI